MSQVGFSAEKYIEEQSRYIPVSYTHLDVYKRQDIVSDDVTDTVSNIKVYKDSRAYLFNDEFEYIAKGEKKDLEEGMYDFLKARADDFRETPDIYNYTSEENGSSAVSCSRLDNGWYFVIVQPMKTAMQPMTCLLYTSRCV